MEVNMKRKMMSALIAAAVGITALAGCGGNAGETAGNGENAGGNENGGAGGDSASGTEVSQAPAGEVERIKIYVPTSGKFDDMDEVMAAVNEISREKIGVEVEFHAYEFGQWFQQYSLFLSGTEDIDILANYGGYLNAVSQGAAYDLTDLLPEYGQDIIALEGDYLKSGEINGVQYAIPIYASYAWNMGISYRQDIVDELGLNEQVAAVKER